MKTTVVIEEKNFFTYDSDYFNIRYESLSNYFRIECGVLFNFSNDQLYVSDPYMDDSTVVKKIESFPNNFYKAYLESGEILHIQCDTTIDNYIFQKIKNNFKLLHKKCNLDDFEIIFGPNNLTLFELHRYTKNRDPDLPRDSVLVIKLRESNSTYYLTILELGKVICKREQVSSFEFLGNKFLCSLKNGTHFNFEILLADYMQQIISDLFELYKIKK